MPLPDDFDAVLKQVEQSGILDEPPEEVDSRLSLAVQATALRSGHRDLADLGVGDWTLNVIRKLKRALHQEMCDPDKKTLKDDYKNLLDKGLSPEGITAVSAAITGVVSLINPTFAVSSVIIFLAIWLLKRGLGHWCSLPPP